MKLNDLKLRKNTLATELKTIAAGEFTDEVRSRVDEIEGELDTVNSDIKRMELIEATNVSQIEREVEVETEERNEVEETFTALKDFFRTGQAPEQYRGSNGGFMLSRDFDLGALTENNKNKTVANELSVAQTPAERLIAQMGVTTYTGLNGDFVVPNMAQVSAGFAAEGVAVTDASASTGSLKLSGRRLGAFQTVTKETLNNSNPAIWQGIINDIRAAYTRAQVADLFDQIEVDAIDASTTQAGTDLTYGDVVDLQANVPFDMVSPVYATTPAIAAGLKKTATIASVDGPIWDGPVMAGEIDGIPAVGSTLANADTLYYIDGAAAVIAEWGEGVELLVNPYEFDVEGKVKVTISGLTDTGFKNANFASFIKDVSI